MVGKIKFFSFMFGYLVSHPGRSESGLAVVVAAHVVCASCFSFVSWALRETVCARVVAGCKVAVGPAISTGVVFMFSIGPHVVLAVAVAVIVAPVSVAAVVAVVVTVGVGAVRAVGVWSSELGFEGADLFVFVLELGSKVRYRVGQFAHGGAIGGHGCCHVG